MRLCGLPSLRWVALNEATEPLAGLHAWLDRRQEPSLAILRPRRRHRPAPPPMRFGTSFMIQKAVS